jgi:(p)ppGpp synthase/HD superfamily hydrolase
VRIVDGCTECDTTPKPPWRERKEHHLSELRNAPPEVLRVVAADKIHNVRSLLLDLRRHGDLLWERFNGGREGTLWYYREMAELIRNGAPREMTEQLDRELAELERLVAGDVEG